ncbi:hypothetical protein BDB00DRAFT_877194 [Zychaea mexicana]|uniref:uncharacterized protein n=1 Tax=Zychaea mexicana TaxID=64656 RepID=UPI0022FF3B0E|nr:uncharacterized protein BDB00DRAFT_877194 [Zychaea mexicana]KAI9488728.1 hypothetical protein BDB00DRAFT_877194 [Zychaea mexicana]
MIATSPSSQFAVGDEHKRTEPIPISSHYEEDDTATTTTAGATLSMVADTVEDNNATTPCFSATPSSSPSTTTTSPSIAAFEKQMMDTTNAQVSRYQNTYFMDGGNRFISLPTLGNTNTKAASHISRLFEEWLENKIYRHPSSNYGYDQHLPILEDSVELLAEDVLNKLKSRPQTMTGMSKVLVKVRTGHVYTYHQLQDGQPLITEDMEDFFQQFPLFVEIMIYTMGGDCCTTTMNDDSAATTTTELLLAVENATINPENPYRIMDEI